MKNIPPKIIGSISLAVLLVGSNGCMTYDTVEHAEGNPGQTFFPRGGSNNPADSYVSNGGRNVYGAYLVPTGDPHPAYYLLLPLTIPADIITSPFQGAFWIFLSVFGPPISS